MSEPRKRRFSTKPSRVKKTRNIHSSRQPRVTVLKRDGHVQPFNRIKMIMSIRNAGATQQEADLVTNRVSKRLVNRETILSKELSSMVARSLSRVNSMASRNYTNNRDRKIVYTQRANSLSSEIAAINQQVIGVAQRIESFNDRIQTLPTRITRIRQGNYRVLTHLETDQANLSKMWTKLSPELITVSVQSETLQSKIRDLQQALTYKLGHIDYDLGNLQDIESRSSEVRLNLSEIQSSVASVLTSLEKKFQNIDKDLRKAENTVSLLSQASFPWEEGETPIIATKVKDLDNDLEAVITLTNLRFILEHEKEIVLKKRLFLVTEKKIVREVAVQKPIGMVTRLVRGRVGFFKGSGLFITFASESGIPEMKFDTTGQDATLMMQSYNYIISGQADEELAAVTPAATADQEVPQLVACYICGAPYNEKIYRGQTSVNCRYCGAVIALQ